MFTTIVGIVFFALGAAAMLIYDHYFPTKAAKAQKELLEEIEALRKKTGT